MKQVSPAAQAVPPVVHAIQPEAPHIPESQEVDAPAAHVPDVVAVQVAVSVPPSVNMQVIVQSTV